MPEPGCWNNSEANLAWERGGLRWVGREGSLSQAHNDSRSTLLLCRFPQPQLPALHLLPQVLGDTVALAFVAYAISVSLAMIYAEKHHYTIDPNQVCAPAWKARVSSGWGSGAWTFPVRDSAPFDKPNPTTPCMQAVSASP